MYIIMAKSELVKNRRERWLSESTGKEICIKPFSKNYVIKTLTITCQAGLTDSFNESLYRKDNQLVKVLILIKHIHIFFVDFFC